MKFIIVGHKAATSGEFLLNDMPGSAGRIDILARCIHSAFFKGRRGFNLQSPTSKLVADNTTY